MVDPPATSSGRERTDVDLTTHYCETIRRYPGIAQYLDDVVEPTLAISSGGLLSQVE
jgi:hypothetical protein